MSIEEMIKQAVHEANRPLLTEIKTLSSKVDELQKTQGDTVNIRGACALLKCSPPTFWRYREDGLVEACGGTEKHPVFFKADVLAIREKLKLKRMRAA